MTKDLSKLYKEDNILTELDLNGFDLQSVNVHNSQFLYKKSYGLIKNYWYEGEDLCILLKTGYKKDIILKTSNLSNLETTLLKRHLKNNLLPFCYDKISLENVRSGNIVFGILYLLRQLEIKQLGNEGNIFGFWNKDVVENNEFNRILLNANLLYRIKRVGFFLESFGNKFYMPEGESLIYFSTKVSYKKYFYYIEKFELILQDTIKLLREVSLVNLIEKKARKKLYKKLFVLQWLLNYILRNLIFLLRKKELVKWRVSFLYLYIYVKSIQKSIKQICDVIKEISKYNLNFNDEKKIEVYFIKVKLNKLKEDIIIKNLMKLDEIEKKLLLNFKTLSFEEKDNINYTLYIFNKVLIDKLKQTRDLKKYMLKIKEGKTIEVSIMKLLNSTYKKSIVSRREFGRINQYLESIFGKRIYQKVKIK